MIRVPNKAEWDTSALAGERRAYLDGGLSFEQIAERMIGSARVIHSLIRPYCDAPTSENDGRQIILVVRVAPQTCDLLYNAPDGMRGRYWQSPDHGFAATKHLIDGVLKARKLLTHEPPVPPTKCAPMTIEDIRASLEGLSAKVWPRERDDGGRPLWVEDQLRVLRWEQSEQDGVKGRQWRRSFISGDLEIKGAIIGTDRSE